MAALGHKSAQSVTPHLVGQNQESLWRGFALGPGYLGVFWRGVGLACVHVHLLVIWEERGWWRGRGGPLMGVPRSGPSPLLLEMILEKGTQSLLLLRIFELWF